MKYTKMLRKTLYHIAVLTNKIKALYKRIAEEFEDCSDYTVCRILHNCRELNGKLYDETGNVVSDSGLIDDKYYCNQYSGYVEDDYHGYMYYKIDDKGTFVEVNYWC